MKKTRILLLGALGLLALIVAAGVAIEVRYGAFLAAPRITHEHVATGRSIVRVAIQPPKAAGLIARHCPASVPQWALPWVMPHEIALVADPNLTTGKAALCGFVNTRRLGPLLAGFVDAQSLTTFAPYIAWSGGGAVCEQRGVVTVRGEATLDVSSREAVEKVWGSVSPLTAPRIEGGHLFEAVVDNRDGGAFALLTTLHAAMAGGDPGYNFQGLAENCYLIATLRLQADMTSETDLGLRIRIECGPEADEGEVQSLAFYLGVLRGQLNQTWKDQYGVEVTGKTVPKGLTVTGEYTLTNVDGMLTALTSPATGRQYGPQEKKRPMTEAATPAAQPPPS